MANSDHTQTSSRGSNRTALIAVGIIALLGLAYALLRVDILRARIATLQGVTQAIEDEDQQLHAQVDELLKTQQKNNVQLDQLMAQVGAINEQIGGLRSGATATKQQWSRIEALYLLRLAQEQLTIGHDIANATKTLTAALTALGNDNATAEVQRQLSQHIEQLHTLPTTLYTQTEQQLQQAADSIMQLPLRINATGAPDEGEPLPESGIDQKWLKLRRALHSLFSIREDTAPTLSQGAQVLGQSQLRTLLQQAAWAVRTQDQASYIAMLKQAQVTLSIVLDTQHAGVRGLQSQLQQLSTLTIAPALPNLEQSIATLERGVPRTAINTTGKQP